MMVYLGAEFYPPAEPPAPEPHAAAEEEEEEDEPQPYVEGQPTIFEPNPPPAKAQEGSGPQACGRSPKPREVQAEVARRRPPRRKKTE